MVTAEQPVAEQPVNRPEPQHLLPRRSIRASAIWPLAVTGMFAYIFFGMVLFAIATNHWQTDTPRAVHKNLVPHANQVSNPGM